MMRNSDGNRRRRKGERKRERRRSGDGEKRPKISGLGFSEKRFRNLVCLLPVWFGL